MNKSVTGSRPESGWATAGWLDSLKRLLTVSEFLIFLVVIVLFVVGAIVNPRFLGIENLKIMTRDTAILANTGPYQQRQDNPHPDWQPQLDHKVGR